MKKSTKFSDVLHILLHMTSSSEPIVSESLAKAMKTNPVVVRRTMAGLRERGFVSSEKGHGGGWVLSCDLKKVTLYDVYSAIGSPSMLALGNRSDFSGCFLEKAVNNTMRKTFDEAEKVILNRLKEITLESLYFGIKENKYEK